MKDFNYAMANEEMLKARDKIHNRNAKIANFWWKIWGSKRVSAAIRKGKYETWILSPSCCPSEICDILRAKRFRFRTTRKNIFVTEVFVNWA